MKNVVSLIKELKLTASEIINYLTEIGFPNPSLNTKIDSELEQQIIDHFSGRKTNVDKPYYIYSKESPKLISVFTKNIFTHFEQLITHPEYKDINSFFTDEQAKFLCLKMSNRRIRYFSNLFLTDASGIDKIELRYQIHYLANKALEFYGGQILTFICQLKNWHANTSNVEVFKAKPNTLYECDTNFPKLYLQSNENNKSYTITFARAYERNNSSYYPLTIMDNRTHTKARISINGQLINSFENCIPEIAIFIECFEGNSILYSGYDDGYCDRCGQPLTDPISIKYGRGPTCRRDYGFFK